ncbi:RNMT-activating mini protein [Fopius arisanus]|uniref:RNMT-activating mini protein n=1 Tax=Fopius arisanus TaxID=64838 RepID=A0A9R1U1S7_9HYME|nr:PREDICTED: RNMT-activating mini protein [Fopius arisanus]
MGKQFLSEEQQNFLESCEEEFKNRFTDDDPDFVKFVETERQKPPIVDPWYNKPRRPQFDWRQGRRRDYDRRNNERSEKNDRYSGRHQSHQRRFRPF